MVNEPNNNGDNPNVDPTQDTGGGTFIVTNLLDSGPGSLRNGINVANANPGAGTIVFDPSLSGGTIDLETGDLLITDDLTINGLGKEELTVRQSMPDDRIFTIDNSDASLINVTIDGLTIKGGSVDQTSGNPNGGGILSKENLTLTNSAVSKNRAQFGSGGGIYATGGKLTLDNVDISNNEVQFGNGGGVAIEDTENTNVLAALNKVDISGNVVSAGHGGGIYVFQANLMEGLTNSRIYNNKASGSGGGLSLNQATVNVLENTDIYDNKSGQNGGGIFLEQANLPDGNNLVISNNEASGHGGGIFAVQATVSALTNSKISDNSSGDHGGGLFIQQATVADLNSNTIADNSAGDEGGGIYLQQGDLSQAANNTLSGNTAGSFGGGIRAFQATVDGFTNNTISNNEATIGGGLAIRDIDTKVELFSNTISGNITDSTNGGGIFIDGGTVELTSNIIAANTSHDGTSGGASDDADIAGFSTLTSENVKSFGFNLIGNGDDVESGTFVSSDIVGDSINPVDPVLGPLADNGGPTQTRALLDGSPAIDAGDPEFKEPPDFDQRGPGSSSPRSSGFPRVSGDAIDIGAFEVTPAFNTIVGTSGDDELNGTPETDDINGLGGDDKIAGKAASDFLSGGGDRDKFIVRADEGTDVISDFGGVGTGTTPSQEVIHEVDTIRFIGHGLTAENMLLTQTGNNLEIAFEPSGDTKVILLDFDLENLDNLTTETGASVTIGNILFDGQIDIEDSFDVVNADDDRTTIFNRNTVTFLNDLENKTSGFNNSDDVINGQGGKDEIDGLSGDDILRGGGAEDKLMGGAGDDVLNGGKEDDDLTGGPGADQFAFITLKPFATSDLGVDNISDFGVGRSGGGDDDDDDDDDNGNGRVREDKIVLSKTTFTALESVVGGTLNPNEFAVVEEESETTDAAEASSAFIVYNRASGSLFYNPNGSDPGFSDNFFGGGEFASLQSNPAPLLDASDILIVA